MTLMTLMTIETLYTVLNIGQGKIPEIPTTVIIRLQAVTSKTKKSISGTTSSDSCVFAWLSLSCVSMKKL
jgi:hypothetical protein